MRYLNDFLRFILNLSYIVRSIIVGTSLLICIVANVVSSAHFSNGFLIVPIALAAWLFSRREFSICMGIICLSLIILTNLVPPPPSPPTPLLVTIILLIVEGLLISSLRDQVMLADAARQHIASLLEQQQQLSQIKDQFILNVNHELRTPLTAVYGYLELLLEYNEQIDSSTRTTFLKNAMYSCEELQLLVSNILDTIQIGNEKDTIYLEELPVIDVVHEVVEHFDPRRQREYPVEVNVPPHLVVRANGQYLRQVLRNLLSNAFKYAPVDTPISITASLYGNTVQTHHPSPEVCISVKDAGPGIPPEDISRLFGQFVRLRRDVSGKVRGTGLGLYVSKQLVEAMEGHIWVESTGISGEGSCFLFTLPCITRAKVTARTLPKPLEVPALPVTHTQQAQST